MFGPDQTERTLPLGADSGQQWMRVEGLISFFGKTHSSGLTGVAWRDGHVAVAHVRADQTPPALDVCEERPDEGDPGQALAGLVDAHGLRGSRCVMVLPPDAYDLRVVNAPDIEPDEIVEAARWLVKDLIEFDLDDAVIDVLDIPVDSGWQRERKLYVVAARAAPLRLAVEWIQAAGLDLVAVELRERALLNLATPSPAERDTAILQLGHKAGLLSVGHAGQLYLARPVSLSPADLEPNWEQEASDPAAAIPHEIENLLLEIQRSLDYCESEFGRSSASRLLIAPCAWEVSDLIPYLTQNLPLDVHLLDFSEFLACDPVPPQALQAACTSALGAALADPAGCPSRLFSPYLPRGGYRITAPVIARLCAIAAVLMAVWCGLEHHQLATLRGELATLQEQQTGIESRARELRQRLENQPGLPALAAQVEALGARRAGAAGLLDALARSQPGAQGRFSSVLEALAHRPVEGLWLREIHLSQGGRDLEFVGSGLEPGLLPRWLQHLERETAFNGTGFKVLRMNRPEQAPSRVDFTLSTQLE